MKSVISFHISQDEIASTEKFGLDSSGWGREQDLYIISVLLAKLLDSCITVSHVKWGSYHCITCIKRSASTIPKLLLSAFWKYHLVNRWRSESTFFHSFDGLYYFYFISWNMLNFLCRWETEPLDQILSILVFLFCIME